jgi:hypothetical protein
MTSTAIYLDRNDVPQQLRAHYSGRKFRAYIVESVTVPADSGTWSGGSRSVYFGVRLDTGERVKLSDTFSAPWDEGRQDVTLELRPGVAVVEHSIFQGKDMGLEFYIHPESAAKLLPAPAGDEPSPHEKIVLIATRSYKSSYNGQDRYDMAKSDYEPMWATDDKPLKYGPYPTRDQWQSAKDSLIEKKLLNRAGAITTKGKNVIGDERMR